MIIHKVEVRNLQIEDYPKLKVAMQSAYDDMENSYWKEKHIKLLLKKFPEGQKVVFINDEFVGPAIERFIEILGEAARQLSDEAKQEYPQVNWVEINFTLRK